MQKWRRKMTFMTLFIFFILFVCYVVWDNSRIKIVQQEIILPDLADEWNEFRILQISDLHEKLFGNEQQRLMKIIESLEYDVIVFTGDMVNRGTKRNFAPFFTLLEQLDSTKPAFFVPGNTDPPSYRYKPVFSKSEFIKAIESYDVTFLESFVTIVRNGKKIHFVNFELAIIENPDYIGRINGSFQARQPYHPSYQTYQQTLWENMIKEDVFRQEETIIALNHFPIPDNRIDYIKTDPHTSWRPFDLIIAGHYHGGQIRLPFLGALFIPEPWYQDNGFFPPEDRVKGLWEYDGTKQYVSAGLGASDAITFLNFRLFNPPEINLLILKNK